MFDEPTNGLDPEGIRWVREFLQSLAGQGRGVLVSSHLLSELSLYVDHLVVIGKGRLLAEGSLDDFESGAASERVVVRSPQLDDLRGLIADRGGHVTDTAGGIEVTGMTAAAIGDVAALRQIPLHELHTERDSLEEAFLKVTAEAQEYRSGSVEGGEATS